MIAYRYFKCTPSLCILSIVSLETETEPVKITISAVSPTIFIRN